MHCDDYQALIPSYLDEELSEVQAAPLRRHLLACPTCRGAVQEERALRAWFVPTPAIAVPEGFAARVARRALAGDRGRVADDLLLPQAPLAGAHERRDEGVLLTFLLRATAVAAAVLFVLSLGIQYQRRPEMDALQALDGVDLGRELENLERLNRAEEDAARRGSDLRPASRDERPGGAEDRR